MCKLYQINYYNQYELSDTEFLCHDYTVAENVIQYPPLTIQYSTLTRLYGQERRISDKHFTSKGHTYVA